MTWPEARGFPFFGGVPCLISIISCCSAAMVGCWAALAVNGRQGSLPRPSWITFGGSIPLPDVGPWSLPCTLRPGRKRPRERLGCVRTSTDAALMLQRCHRLALAAMATVPTRPAPLTPAWSPPAGPPAAACRRLGSRPVAVPSSSGGSGLGRFPGCTAAECRLLQGMPTAVADRLARLLVKLV
jgi:hypothetical protein